MVTLERRNNMIKFFILFVIITSAMFLRKYLDQHNIITHPASWVLYGAILGIIGTLIAMER